MIYRNLESGRDLREGDTVRSLAGPNLGHKGDVVGFDPSDPVLPILVRFPRDGSVHKHGPNSLRFETSIKKVDILEPLPPLLTSLTEKFRTCGTYLCVEGKTGEIFTFIPKDENSVDLSESFSTIKNEKGRLEEFIRNSFVTRLPHLLV